MVDGSWRQVIHRTRQPKPAAGMPRSRRTTPRRRAHASRLAVLWSALGYLVNRPIKFLDITMKAGYYIALLLIVWGSLIAILLTN